MASGGTEPSYACWVLLADAARHGPTLNSSNHTMNRPTPTREELPSGVRPRTLKTEPSRKDGGGGQPGHTQPAPDQVGPLDRERERCDQRGDRPDDGGAALQLVKSKHGRGLVGIGHPDQGRLGGVGHKAHGHKHPTTDPDCDGQGLLPGAPDDRDQGGQERDEGQQRQRDGNLAGARAP
jgi:hypothetical protein